MNATPNLPESSDRNSIEIAAIVRGALNGDTHKVRAYTRQLIERLREQGDSRLASRLQSHLDGEGPKCRFVLAGSKT